jgi:glycosyltransferase involved in cell wall biosynthesis
MVNDFSRQLEKTHRSLSNRFKGKLAEAWQCTVSVALANTFPMEPKDMAADATKASPPGPTLRRHPAVSIVVPCFNGGRFLDALMTSLGHQTFRDFEIIIVDDGSTDEETPRKLASLRDRVRVIHQDNRGPSAARNTGARAASGDALFMLDCDDTIESDFLAETVPLLQSAPADVGMVFTHLRLMGAENGLVSRYFNRFDLLFTNTVSSGLILRKDAWRAVGGYDESMRDGYEDWDFSLRLASAGFRGIEVSKPLYIYHIGDDSRASRSSRIDKKRLYGTLWRQIREKHAESYRPLAMLRLWNQSRQGHTQGHAKVRLWKGFAAYTLALLLPDALFSQLIARLHRKNRADASVLAFSGAASEPRLVP